MTRILLLSIVALTLGIPAAHGQSVYGTWRGVYTITEMFTGFDVPYGTPPYEPANVELVLHPFDSALGHFGIFSGQWAGDLDWYSSIVVALSQNANDVTLTVFSPDEGEPTGYGDLALVLSGDSLSGTVNDRSPAGFMWVHARGTVSLTRVVPEPSAALLGMIGAGALAGYGRRKRLARKRLPAFTSVECDSPGLTVAERA